MTQIIVTGLTVINTEKTQALLVHGVKYNTENNATPQGITFQTDLSDFPTLSLAMQTTTPVGITKNEDLG